MNKATFQSKLKQLQRQHEQLIKRRNRPQKIGNGIFDRYEFPVVTAEHTPLFWRYDFNHATNPHLMTRLGINCAFNVGAMEWNGNIVLMTRDGRLGPQILLRRGRKQKRDRWVQILGLSGAHAGIRSPRKRICMTCAWCAMRTAGFMACSAPNGMTIPSRAIFRRHRPLRHCPHKGSGEMGTVAGFKNARAAPTKLRFAS